MGCLKLSYYKQAELKIISSKKVLTFIKSENNNRSSYLFTFNGKAMTIKYAFYFTGGYDDILYTIQENNPFPINSSDLTNPRKVNILTQNTYMRPSELFFDDQSVRKNYYDDLLKNYDAIIFQEMFDDDVRSNMLSQLSAEYPYQTSVVDIPNHGVLDPIQDGGILIVSRWPLEAQDQFLFGNNCNADDCLAYKGFKYAKINKLGVPYHLFNTHMDAFNEQVDVNIRKSQLQQAKSFIASKSIPTDQAVIFGGDLNIDKITNKWGEYDSLWTPFFDAQMPVFDNPLNPSWNSATNKYLSGTSDAPEYLDYVLPMKSNLLPISAINKVRPYRTIADPMWKKFDISDHYSVSGIFEYAGSVPTCASTNGLQVTNITQTSALSSWTPVVGSLGYNVRYKPTAGSAWVTVSTATNSLTISGLAAGTAYEVQVQNNCGGLLFGAWSLSSNFTTLPNTTCTDNYETNETRSNAKTIAVNTNITAKIGTTTDVDWFKFSNTTAQKNIKLNLTNLPADYNLQLYKSNGSLLATSANTGTNNESITYNTSTVATYYAKVYGVSGSNNAQCYNLLATISNTALRLDESEGVVETVKSNVLKLYPNPTNSRLTIEFDLEEVAPILISIYDVSGKLISTENYEGVAGSNAFYKDVFDLTNGFYIITISSEDKFLYNAKFIRN
jgi:endonuclease/exonuclease/phosphatase family metal-dependent hydrolase